MNCALHLNIAYLKLAQICLHHECIMWIMTKMILLFEETSREIFRTRHFDTAKIAFLHNYCRNSYLRYIVIFLLPDNWQKKRHRTTCLWGAQ